MPSLSRLKILVIKTSSLGDVIHTLPGISDLANYLNEPKIDWIVEDCFAEIPELHQNIHKVYKTKMRSWKKKIFNTKTIKEIYKFHKELKQNQYDVILDPQGLIKSVIWCFGMRNASGKKPRIYGLDKNTIGKEKICSLVYTNPLSIDTSLHAIVRIRLLFAMAFGYFEKQDFKESITKLRHNFSYKFEFLNYQNKNIIIKDRYLVFVCWSSWKTKHMPIDFWQSLFIKANKEGFKVILVWGSTVEHQESLNLAKGYDNVKVSVSKLGFYDLSFLFRKAVGLLTVDTGLSHFAGSLNLPVLTVYRVTDVNLIGTYGANSCNISSPIAYKYIKKFASDEEERESLQNLEPNSIWEKFMHLVNNQPS